MQQSITRDRLYELFELLSPFQQRTVIAFIDSLLGHAAKNKKRDKRALLNLSVWNEDDIQAIKDAQQRINEWQVPTF